MTNIERNEDGLSLSAAGGQFPMEEGVQISQHQGSSRLGVRETRSVSAEPPRNRLCLRAGSVCLAPRILLLPFNKSF